MALSSKLRMWLKQAIGNTPLSVELADAVDANTAAGASNAAAISAQAVVIAQKIPLANGDQATTDTGANVGQVAVTDLTAATGKVLVTCAEDPGAALVLSDVVVSDGYFTVFCKNTNTDARAELDSKKVNYLILSL